MKEDKDGFTNGREFEWVLVHSGGGKLELFDTEQSLFAPAETIS
jgi:hypothetical protein